MYLVIGIQFRIYYYLVFCWRFWELTWVLTLNINNLLNQNNSPLQRLRKDRLVCVLMDTKFSTRRTAYIISWEVLLQCFWHFLPWGHILFISFKLVFISLYYFKKFDILYLLCLKAQGPVACTNFHISSLQWKTFSILSTCSFPISASCQT